MAEDSFIRLYSSYKPIESRQKDAPAYNSLPSYSGREDSKIQADVYKVQETFKDFLKPIKEVKQEVDRLDLSTKDKHNARHMVFSALSPIVPIRRISSVPDNIEDGNYARAAGILGLMAINLPEDGRDLKDAFNQLIGKYKPSYDYKKYQHTFSFFKGTLAEGLLRLPGNLGKYISNKLQNADKTLYATKFGEIICKVLNIDLADKPFNTGKTYGNNKKVWAYCFKGNAIKQNIGRALVRTPVISVFVLSLLEIPAILKSFNNRTNDRISQELKQIAKSATYIASIFSGIGLAGAVLAKKGPTGSLIGMGIGAVAGSNLSQLINKQIDKI